MQPSLSLAVTVIGKLPDCVGVPESTPLLNPIPFGSGPEWAKATGEAPLVSVKVTGG